MTKCSACGHTAPNAVEHDVCEQCGFASGGQNRCPHCTAISRIEARGAGFVCAVCGGPRIPGGLGGDDAARALREEKAARGRALRGRASTIAWSLLAVFATLVAAVAWPHSIAAKLILVAFAVIPAILALRSKGGAGKADGLVVDAANRAWLAAATEAARSQKNGITAGELSKRLDIPLERADGLLTELAVHERTRIDVGDDAEVRYAVAPDASLRADRELTDEEDFDRRLQKETR